MDLKTPLSELTGIGPNLAKKLARLNLFTIEDFIYHFPFRYDDFSQNSSLDQAKVGETVTLKGELWSIKNVYTRFGKNLTQATFNDGTGTIEIIWFNQPWLTKNLKTGDKLQVSGKLNRKGNKLSLISPVWEKFDYATPEVAQRIHTGRLTPVYPETYGLTSKWLRLKISQLLPKILNQIADPLPAKIIQDFLPLTRALSQIHFPDDLEQAKKARERLSFDELFYIQLNTQRTKSNWQQKKLIQPLNIDREKLSEFIKNLPFELTSAQKKVIEEIIADILKDYPMNRLVWGEVGSGKTVVAAIIAFLIHLNGLKTVFMAPTEILAFQHYQTFLGLLQPYGIEIGIYTGSRKYTQSQKSSDPNIIIGTHALLSDKLILDNVGLIIIDEQQRFGVEQRSFLRHRSRLPHFLTMTATPIPRTVALTLYGDLDLSLIDQLPKGRKTVRTHFVPAKRRMDAYQFIAKQIETGFQVYIITPLIEQSETLISVKAAKIEYERLKKDIFPKYRLGLLHGKLKSKEKEAVINDFKKHELDILVSTSVVEVGVDVQNATIMVIEGAERFGLAQLHQLRGRVGRGKIQSYAFLFTEIEESAVVNRLKNLEKINDGLKLAELDLKIRGGGEMFGTAQSGRWNLKVASLSDLDLIEKSKEAATSILKESPNLDKYPEIRGKLSDLADIMPD